MKVMIDLGTADVEMQRSDGTWEKVQHCRTRISVDETVLKVELAAVLTGTGLTEVREYVSSFGGSTVPRSVRPEPPTPPGPRQVSGTPMKSWYFWKR